MPTQPFLARFEVLVVDDDDAVRDLIVSYFNALQMPVSSATDGRGAIAALQRSQGRFGLVITDLNLPGADGFAVLQAAKQANASCYVVIVTGYATLDSAVQAVRVGAYDYLAKPFSVGQLDVVLRRVADHARLGNATRRPAASLVPSSPLSIEERLSRIEEILTRIDVRLAHKVF